MHNKANRPKRFTVLNVKSAGYLITSKCNHITLISFCFVSNQKLKTHAAFTMNGSAHVIIILSCILDGNLFAKGDVDYKYILILKGGALQGAVIMKFNYI